MFKILLNNKFFENSVVSIGNFDGLHLGHKNLLQELTVVSKKENLTRILITFEPTPQEFFHTNSNKKHLGRISLLRDKFFILKREDLVDQIIVFKFNKCFSSLSPKYFIENILIKELKTKHVVVGKNWRFGRNAEGTYEDLLKYNIEVSLKDKLIIDNKIVSSSNIRQAAEINNFEIIQKYLGGNLHFTSKVVHGHKMARKFGVPTINFNLGKKKLAFWGIYAAYVYIENIRYKAVAGIGKNPTTNNFEIYKLEAHLLDVDLDLYGKIARVEILYFIREEKKFDSLDELFKTIHKDIECAREYFRSLN